MSDVFEYINKIVDLCQYPVTFAGERPNVINRWLVTSHSCEIEAVRTGRIEPLLHPTGEMVLEHEVSFASKEKLESNWRYYKASNDGKNVFDPLFGREDKYIYGLCNIFCRENTDVLFYVRASSPINIWMNGQMVLMSNFYYHIKPFLFTYRLRKGNNSFLVEKGVCEETRSLAEDEMDFLITLKPWNFLLDERNQHIFTNSTHLQQMKQSYNIIPDRAILAPGQELGLTVLPRYFAKENQEEVKVEVFNDKNEKLHSTLECISERFVLDLDSESEGVLHICVSSLKDGMKESDIYIYRGDFEAKRMDLLEALEKRRDVGKPAKDFIRYISEIQQISDGKANGIKELMIERQYYYIFSRLSETLKFLETPETSPDSIPLRSIPVKAMTVFKRSDVDNIFFFHTVFLPKNYDPQKKYPLILYLAFSTIQAKIPEVPDFIYRHQFDDVIVAGLYGRGGFNKDYINEAVIIHSIREIVENYPIDRERIHTIGICTGALRSFGLALRLPDLFASLMSIGGIIRMDINHPDYRHLENLNSMAIYQLCNIEDEFFNTSRVIHTSQYLKNTKNWYFDSYSHKESVEMFNTGELFKKLVKHQREKYPLKVSFITYEPIYNKAFWLKIEFMADLHHKSTLVGEIKDADVIEIETENIECFSALLYPEDMQISNHLSISINGIVHKISIEGPSKMYVGKCTGSPEIRLVPMLEEDFYREYNRIGIEESQLGIKQVHFKKCKIIKPDHYREERKSFARKLLIMLQQPLRERQRNYIYELVNESEISEETLSSSNFVYVVDPQQIDNRMQQVLDAAGVRVDKTFLEYRGQSFTGEYFALIKSINPFNHDKTALLLILNGDSLEEELLKLMSSFDSNPVFYHEAVVYSEGWYHPFR